MIGIGDIVFLIFLFILSWCWKFLTGRFGGENVVISKFQRKGRRQLLLLATAAERERESRTTTTMKVLMVFIDTEDSSINFTLLVLRNLCFSRSKKNNRTITYQKNRTWCVTVSSNFSRRYGGRTERSISVPVLEEFSSHKY